MDTTRAHRKRCIENHVIVLAFDDPAGEPLRRGCFPMTDGPHSADEVHPALP